MQANSNDSIFPGDLTTALQLLDLLLKSPNCMVNLSLINSVMKTLSKVTDGRLAYKLCRTLCKMFSMWCKSSSSDHSMAVKETISLINMMEDAYAWLRTNKMMQWATHLQNPPHVQALTELLLVARKVSLSLSLFLSISFHFFYNYNKS